MIGFCFFELSFAIPDNHMEKFTAIAAVEVDGQILSIFY